MSSPLTSCASSVPGAHGTSSGACECAKQCSRTRPAFVTSTSSGDAGWQITASTGDPIWCWNGRPSDSR
jgi:hypothetical protein